MNTEDGQGQYVTVDSDILQILLSKMEALEEKLSSMDEKTFARDTLIVSMLHRLNVQSQMTGRNTKQHYTVDFQQAVEKITNAPDADKTLRDELHRAAAIIEHSDAKKAIVCEAVTAAQNAGVDPDTAMKELFPYSCAENFPFGNLKRTSDAVVIASTEATRAGCPHMIGKCFESVDYEDQYDPALNTNIAPYKIPGYDGWLSYADVKKTSFQISTGRELKFVDNKLVFREFSYMGGNDQVEVWDETSQAKYEKEYWWRKIDQRELSIFLDMFSEHVVTLTRQEDLVIATNLSGEVIVQMELSDGWSEKIKSELQRECAKISKFNVKLVGSTGEVLHPKPESIISRLA